MNVLHLVYSGLGGATSVVFSLIEGDKNKILNSKIIFTGPKIYKNYKIFLLVPNKNAILDKVKNSNVSSNYITKYITKDNILDKNDLNKYFLEFKKDFRFC